MQRPVFFTPKKLNLSSRGSLGSGKAFDWNSRLFEVLDKLGEMGSGPALQKGVSSNLFLQSLPEKHCSNRRLFSRRCGREFCAQGAPAGYRIATRSAKTRFFVHLPRLFQSPITRDVIPAWATVTSP